MPWMRSASARTDERSIRLGDLNGLWHFSDLQCSELRLDYSVALSTAQLQESGVRGFMRWVLARARRKGYFVWPSFFCGCSTTTLQNPKRIVPLSPNGIHRECRQLCHFSDSHGARSAVWALGHVKRIHSGLLGLESRAWKIGLPGWASYKFRVVAMFMAVALEACREIA